MHPQALPAGTESPSATIDHGRAGVAEPDAAGPVSLVWLVADVAADGLPVAPGSGSALVGEQPAETAATSSTVTTWRDHRRRPTWAV
ncbi:hypothetical protein GCM10009826_15700 [Humibacillus xanthopallidus]